LRVRISEIFTSIEGEGIYIGTKTLFVRLAGCPLRCYYCDTPYALSMSDGREYGVEEAFQTIKENLSMNTFKVNFTGGEPLLQHLALYKLLELIKQRLGLRIYLESSCFDSDRFLYLLPLLDICKVEFKLSDALAVDSRHYPILLDNALKCLRYAIDMGKITYIKVVVGISSSEDELGILIRRIFEDMNIGKDYIKGFILQPVHGKGEPTLDKMLKFYDIIYPYYEDVRIIPQLHKVMGIP
jgi:7-carboxy-7-deazaguanine synthase